MWHDENGPKSNSANGGYNCCAKSASISQVKRCPRQSVDHRLRDYFVRTNLDLCVMGIFLVWYHARAVYAETATDTTHESTGEGYGNSGTSEEEVLEEEAENVYAVLFPW